MRGSFAENVVGRKAEQDKKSGINPLSGRRQRETRCVDFAKVQSTAKGGESGNERDEKRIAGIFESI